MSNLISFEITVPQLSTHKLNGDYSRTTLYMQIVGNQAFDLAFMPIGVPPQAINWLDGALHKDQPILNIATTGDVWLRDTNNTGDEVLRVVSDVTPVFTNET